MLRWLRKPKETKTRSAGVYLHPTEIILHAYRLSQAGFAVACPPVLRFSTTAAHEEIGVGLRNVLNAFQAGLPDPDDWKDARSDFLRNTGFRSWKAFQGTGVRSCWVYEDDREITLTPLRNGGNKGSNAGFQPFGREPVTVPIEISDQALGQMLLAVLSECE